jgi:hypothetical protein
LKIPKEGNGEIFLEDYKFKDLDKILEKEKLNEVKENF